MADHFKFYPAEDTVVAPWTAQYSYPAQSNKAMKSIARIQPRSGTSFGPGQIMRIDIPAQAYINTTNTQLVFDAVLIGPSNSSAWAVRFQNSISCIFNRLRFLYGGTPQEDIQQYGVLTRLLTEWTTTNQMGKLDQLSISDGVGGFVSALNVAVSNATGPVYSNYNGFVNTRQRFIQGVQANFGTSVGALNVYNAPNSDPSTLPAGIAPPSTPYTVRRYMISLALGLFCQDKLIPAKWMASQLTLEFTLEQANSCIYQPFGVGTNTTNPTFAIGNVELILEQIDFDDQYDQDFLDALETKGIPIKFSTWDWFQFSTQGGAANQYQITERSRSIKGMFVVQRRNPPDFQYDSHACFFDTNSTHIDDGTGGSTLQSTQWRVGGRYLPGSPTQYSANVGGKCCNGGAEGILDLQKFLNTVGNYSLSTNTSVMNFAVPAQVTATPPVFNEYDYAKTLVGWSYNGIPVVAGIEGSTISGGNSAGNMPSGCFAAAINFETSNGIEIAGLNGEEQTDISFNVRWSGAQTTGFVIEAFVFVDKMWVLKPNNYVDLIQ